LTENTILHIIKTVELEEVDMGLDMYAYVAARAGQQQEYWESYVTETEKSSVTKPREIAYWRKHPNLHGWMEQLWRGRNTDSSVDPTFNGVELELTWEDLEQLEEDIKNGRLPSTTGFFFGSDSDDYYRLQDLEFVRQARAELFTGLKVFYNSSW
jgi:hypothetical protein